MWQNYQLLIQTSLSLWLDQIWWFLNSFINICKHTYTLVKKEKNHNIIISDPFLARYYHYSCLTRYKEPNYLLHSMEVYIKGINRSVIFSRYLNGIFPWSVPLCLLLSNLNCIYCFRLKNQCFNSAMLQFLHGKMLNKETIQFSTDISHQRSRWVGPKS